MSAELFELPKKRILLAEDDDSMRGFLERALERAGYTVVLHDLDREERMRRFGLFARRARDLRRPAANAGGYGSFDAAARRPRTRAVAQGTIPVDPHHARDGRDA